MILPILPAFADMDILRPNKTWVSGAEVRSGAAPPKPSRLPGTRISRFIITQLLALGRTAGECLQRRAAHTGLVFTATMQHEYCSKLLVEVFALVSR